MVSFQSLRVGRFFIRRPLGGAVVEAERDVAQDHFVADGDETSHFVHGVDDEGFV